MGTIERAGERARERADSATRRAGRELREARRDRNLSLAVVGDTIGLTPGAVSRIERGMTPEVSVLRLAQLAEAVGLEVSVRLYAGSGPIRDAGHAALLTHFREMVHPSLRWTTEAPFPRPGDQRAWDAMLAGPGWCYGVEAETAPRDVQALGRRLAIKVRDGGADGVLLVLPRTRHVRAFLAAGHSLLDLSFPIAGRTARDRLAMGLDPGGSSIVLV